ncbi:hypothetical protein PBV87_20375 [Niameybacter massiliensis]|uniref:Uncharacterized protein n=1 Tax=Holtiella tumoricola TaxID=3018743 RepID=A0AA42J372_9FIRM|nr:MULTISPECIES: hypothetical protein [Lachnospirales]MDA3733833.1 hypothetical protein [Holtiella tumoricola]
MPDISELMNFSFAEDVEAEWDMYMEEGDSIEDATTQILDQYMGMLDEKESVELYVALALIQMSLEEMDDRVKKEVSEMIGTKTLEGCFDKDVNIRPYLQKLKKACR